MPHHKQFLSGFDFEEKQSIYKKKKFDKNTVIPDLEKSCHSCTNCKLLDMSRKRSAYHCELKNYTFMNYWKQTIAPDCDSFNSL